MLEEKTKSDFYWRKKYRIENFIGRKKDQNKFLLEKHKINFNFLLEIKFLIERKKVILLEDQIKLFIIRT